MGISPGYSCEPSHTSITRKGLVTYQRSPLIYSDANQKHGKDSRPTKNSTPYGVHSRHIPRGAGRDNFRAPWHHLARLLAGGLVTYSSAKSANGRKKLRRTDRPTVDPCMDNHDLSVPFKHVRNVNERWRKIKPLEQRLPINLVH